MQRRLRRRDVTVTHEPPDGYWIDLPAGWIMPGGEHGIVEDTKRAALARVGDAIPCTCEQCRRRT
jgi:8-oxo-dGTP pyrophosphatase MutT (NUDIX family)